MNWRIPLSGSEKCLYHTLSFQTMQGSTAQLEDWSPHTVLQLLRPDMDGLTYGHMGRDMDIDMDIWTPFLFCAFIMELVKNK